MSIRTAVANALSFAHLAGIGRSNPKASAAAEDDDDEKKKPGYAKAEGDEDKKPEDDDKPDDAADDKPEDDGEDDDKPKGKAAAEGEGDDDKDEEMRGNSPAAAARRRERARCAAIFASPAAAGNVTLAAQLAFGTTMNRHEAVALLHAAPAPTRSGPVHASRMQRNPSLDAGGLASQSSKQAVSASMDRAFVKANPDNAKRSRH